MTQPIPPLPDDLEPVRERLAAFRRTQPVRSRLPEPLWAAATELAARYGVHRIARELHLDYTGLKKRVERQARPPAPGSAADPPAFLELAGPLAVGPRCRIEVEAAHGKLCLELPALATTELASLLRVFLGQ
jgi:hypothetical protein